MGDGTSEGPAPGTAPGTAPDAAEPRWRVPVLGALLVALAIAVPWVITATGGVVPASAGMDATVPRDATTTEVEVTADDLGVLVAMQTGFADDVTLSEARLHAAGARAQVSLWPLDGRDHEGEDPTRVELPAGTEVLLEGRVLPDCTAATARGPLVFSVRARRGDGGGWRPRHFVERDPSGLVRAVGQWCDGGARVMVVGSMITPQGYAEIYLRVINPGPGVVAVEVPALSGVGASWERATTTVPPGDDAMLTVRGREVGCEPGERASWTDGRLLVEGEPVEVAGDDAWC